MTVTPTPVPPGKDHRYRIVRLQGSLKGTVTATALTVLRDDGATALWDIDITAAGPFDFDLAAALGGLQVPRDDTTPATNPGTFTVTLGAGGASVVGKLNVIYALEF